MLPGQAYERRIVNNLRKYQQKKQLAIVRSNRSTFDKYSVDLTIKLPPRNMQTVTVNTRDATTITFELKTNERARMGSGSIEVIPVGNKVMLLNTNDAIDGDVFELIRAKVNKNTKLQENLVKLIAELNAVKLPTYGVPKTEWEKIVQKKLVNNVASSIVHDARSINQHYLSKNIDYLQIGGKGLYRLSERDILGLGNQAPILNGAIRAELRAGRTGENNKQQVGVNYRVEYRLAGGLSGSSLSLEKDSDIVKMFNLSNENN